MDSHQRKLLIDYIQLRKLTQVKNPVCWINHLMLNPSKNKLIFLFRWQETKRNHILISLDIKTNNCKIIYRSKVISHYNWIDDNRIICFMEYKTVKGYYVININSGEIKESKDLDPLTNLDGHPSISGNIFVTDTYPNKRGIQKLLIKDSLKSKIYEFYHPLKYNKQTRCDLHPSIKGDLIFFNSVHSGKRKSYFNFMKNL